MPNKVNKLKLISLRLQYDRWRSSMAVGLMNLTKLNSNCIAMRNKCDYRPTDNAFKMNNEWMKKKRIDCLFSVRLFSHHIHILCAFIQTIPNEIKVNAFYFIPMILCEELLLLMIRMLLSFSLFSNRNWWINVSSVKVRARVNMCDVSDWTHLEWLWTDLTHSLYH